MNFYPILIVGAGGFIGTVLRYLLGVAGQKIAFPHGTLIANLLGCFVLGIVTALAAKTDLMSPTTRLFLATGICGGFTTMSAFTHETVLYARDAEYLRAAVYCISTVAGSAATFCAGIFVGRIGVSA